VVVLYFLKNILKGDDFIGKHSFRGLENIAGFGLGVAFTAASFFILKKIRRDLHALRERVEALEYDRLREAYKQAGYDFD